MTLTRIKCFVEAARCENFTEASRRLFMSQPSLSKQIYLIEEELGIRLFYRVKRHVRLTPAGQYLFQQLEHIPDMTDRAFDTARSIGRSGTGVLSIGVLEGQEINETILERMGAFSHAYPGIDVHMQRNGFQNLRSGLLSGHYDIIITMSFEEENIPEVESHIIIKQRGAFAINRMNPLCEVDNLTIDMLAEENFLAISPAESPKGYALLLKQCHFHGFEPKIIRQLNSLESLILGVEAGMGIAILDRNTRLEANSLVRIVPIEGSDYSHVCAMTLKSNDNQFVSAMIKALSCPETGF